MNRLKSVMGYVLLLSLASVCASAGGGVPSTTTGQGGVRFLAPAAPGGLPLSSGVWVGNLLFLSGQLGYIEASGTLVEGGIKAETRQALDNIKAVVEAQGLQMADIVKCTAMLADIAEWPAFNDTYHSYFSPPYPARTAVGVSGLGLDARIEIECIAAARG